MRVTGGSLERSTGLSELPETGIDDFARHRGAPHQLGDDIHFRMGHHLAPVGGAKDRVGLLAFDYNRPAAQRLHSQCEPQLQRDLLGVLCENR